jgi:hypothetical protein
LRGTHFGRCLLITCTKACSPGGPGHRINTLLRGKTQI